jgi:hypothetical protein
MVGEKLVPLRINMKLKVKFDDIGHCWCLETIEKSNSTTEIKITNQEKKTLGRMGEMRKV